MPKNDTFGNMEQKIQQLDTPAQQPTFVAFDPFSAIVIKKIAEAKDINAKIALFESIMNDERVDVINIEVKARTVLYPNNRGKKSKHWEQTKQMAYDLNKNGIDVVFLPEYDSDTSADSVIRIGKVCRIADFKYASTTNSNTLATELKHGFEQANTIVLKLDQMDGGQFRDCIDYLNRNGIKTGDILLINKYGKNKYLSYPELRNNKYQKLIKGFL